MENNYGTSIAERAANRVEELKQALAFFSRGLHVALPATVLSFNAEKQTISAKPAIRELLRVDGTPTIKELPQLDDVPVVLPRAGGFTLTFPIQPGDECLIVFADTCIDAWYQSGGLQNKMSERRHALADGFAIVGIWSQQRKLANYSTGSVMLRNDEGTTAVEVAESTINVIANQVNVQANNTCSVLSYGSCTVHADDVCTVESDTSVRISGNGSVQIEGKDWLSHQHTGVAGGSGFSGPVR